MLFAHDKPLDIIRCDTGTMSDHAHRDEHDLILS